MTYQLFRSVMMLWIGLIASCSSNQWDGGDGGGSDSGVDSGDGSSTVPENTRDACLDGRDNDGDGMTDCHDPQCSWLAECSASDSGPPEDGDLEPCEGISAEANNLIAPVDIIWVVDSSDSMSNDARAVQENLDDFTGFIASSGTDFHVVMISDQGFVAPSPLFASDPERFLFVDRHVGSQDVFARALDQFSSYEHFLRSSAITHVVGVTDDDDDMSASSYLPQMTGRLGHDFVFHAIAATAGMFGIPCTRGFIPAASVGDRYFDAAEATGGHSFSICTDDWSGLFRTLAETVAVTEELPCVFELPEPPEGTVFDRSRVNVEHTPEGGAPRIFPYSGSGADCGSALGWYYDDEISPSQIILCSASCDAVTAGPGRVEIRLGCETILI